MANFLIEKPSDSNACILIGRVPKNLDLRANPWRTILWIVDEAGAAEGCGRLPEAAATSILPVDQSTAEQLETAVEDFFKKTLKHLPSLYVTRELPTAYEKSFLAAAETVMAIMESQQRTRLTRQQDAFSWQSYLFENAGHYVRRRVPDQWQGALAGLPALVSGAGPSLDVSAPALARAAEGAVVFAADSSLRALARLGVQADFAVSVDVAKMPAKCLPDVCAPHRVILVATSPPDWSRAISDEGRFYLSSNQLTLDWFASHGVSRTKISARENCGATALELARFLGCSPIYLFGIDLALCENGSVQRHHKEADASLYTRSGFNPGQHFPKVPGNFLPEVSTHVIGDWRTLDQRLAGWPAGLISVVTDRGAKLRNTTLLRPEEFLLPGAGMQKKARLAALPPIEPQCSSSTRLISEKLGRFGNGLMEWVPSLRKTLDTGGPSALAARLRSLFALPENGQILGAYSLKLMPQLLPPIEEDIGHWATILDELESLARHASGASAALAAIDCRD